ncbi:basic proline-rich protein-like [Pseudopipra pipra]|uniref:basic proline-rich protein-like n=1 Tax=Pseudopipra pipra TaxID=415032 RepID=UPI0031387391
MGFVAINYAEYGTSQASSDQTLYTKWLRTLGQTHPQLSVSKRASERRPSPLLPPVNTARTATLKERSPGPQSTSARQLSMRPSSPDPISFRPQPLPTDRGARGEARAGSGADTRPTPLPLERRAPTALGSGQTSPGGGSSQLPNSRGATSKRANPCYLTRRAAGAEHHLNPRRERARPPARRGLRGRGVPAVSGRGVPDGAALRSRGGSAPHLLPSRSRRAPAARQRPGARSGYLRGEAAKAWERGTEPLRPRRPPGEPGPQPRGGSGAALHLPPRCRPPRPASRELSRPEPPPPPPRLPRRRGADQQPARGRDEAPVNLPPFARSLAERTRNRRFALLAGAPAAAAAPRRPPACFPPHAPGSAERAAEPLRRRAPATGAGRHRAGQGGAGRGGARRSARLPPPPAAVTHLPAPTAPSPPGAVPAGSRRPPHRPRSAGHVTGAPRPAEEGGSRRAASSMGEAEAGPR